MFKTAANAVENGVAVPPIEVKPMPPGTGWFWGTLLSVLQRYPITLLRRAATMILEPSAGPGERACQLA
jgi:hypothetical protein